MVGMIVGEQLTKVSAQRKKLERRMAITNNIQLKAVTKREFAVGGEKKPGLAFGFTFTSKYGADAGVVEVEGEVFFIDDKKKLDDIEKIWGDKKRIEDDKLLLPIMNRALEIGYLQAIAMADQLKLPPPLQMPRFIGKKPAAAAKAA